jgi:PAS domain S-box-containing protein
MFRETQEDGASHSVRAYFGVLVVVVLIPGLLIAGWLSYLSAKSARQQIEQDAIHRAHEIAAAIDREIVNTLNLLAVLSTSHSLQTGDFQAFHRQAVEIARQLKIQVVLRDPRADRQVLNSALPWGAQLPEGVPLQFKADEEKAMLTGRAVVSNVFLAPVVKKQMVRVVMPALKQGDGVLFLTIGLPLSTFGEILDRLQTDPDRVAAIVDRNNVIVARSEQHDQFAGTTLNQPPPPDTVGVVRGVTRDQVPFHWFRTRSDVSGWFISVGVPDRVLEAPAQFAIFVFTVVSSALLLAAFAVASVLGGQLSETIGILSTALATARRHGREQFETLFESVPSGIVTIDGNGRVVLVNRQVESLFGYRRDELIGQAAEILLPERYRVGQAAFMAALAGNSLTKALGAGRALHGRRKDGSEFLIEVGLTPTTTSAGDLVMATVTDISARKKAETERDDLRRRIVQSQEQERLRLAHELHDRTGQELSAAMLELKGIEAQASQAARERIRRLRQQLDQMGKTLHQVAWELRPASIDDLGMACALGSYVSDWSERYGIAADFHCGDANIDLLSEEVRTTIYRVVQEGLTNVAKHARGAKSVSVVIDRNESMLRLTIEDDGCGFDPADRPEPGSERRGGLGHAGMQERLALIGGQLEIEASVGVGTTIFVRIPLIVNEAAA